MIAPGCLIRVPTTFRLLSAVWDTIGNFKGYLATRRCKRCHSIVEQYSERRPLGGCACGAVKDLP